MNGFYMPGLASGNLDQATALSELYQRVALQQAMQRRQMSGHSMAPQFQLPATQTGAQSPTANSSTGGLGDMNTILNMLKQQQGGIQQEQSQGLLSGLFGQGGGMKSDFGGGLLGSGAMYGGLY